jgi:hypothetical protein
MGTDSTNSIEWKNVSPYGSRDREVALNETALSGYDGASQLNSSFETVRLEFLLSIPLDSNF